MRAKELIEKLEDLASHFALKRKEMHLKASEAKDNGVVKVSSYYKGVEATYGLAFLKVDSIIKEAKR